MDTLSHGLWGAALFGKEKPFTTKYNKKDFWFAFFLGAGPDLLSFSPSFIYWAFSGFPAYQKKIGEPPPLSIIPSYVFQLYNITHSLIIWSALFLFFWIVLKKPLWVFCAWALHIVCDIPTHTTLYFPTPFLWPFPTPFVNGFRWATPIFLLSNYFLLISFFIFLKMKNKLGQAL